MDTDKQEKHSKYSELDESDKSCVHAVIVIGVVVAGLAFIIYPAGIFDISSANLTAGDVLRLIGAGIIGILALLIFIDVISVFMKR